MSNPSSSPSDDDILEAEAIGEEDPAGVVDAELVDDADEEQFVDGTVGRSDLAAERDEFRDAFLRVKADFENYKKRSEKGLADRIERATGQLVTQLLPVLDACDAAIGHGVEEVEPIQKSFLESLGREGLERLDPIGEVFDPNLHEAVMHEEGDPGAEPTVVASLRIGYAWKGKVIRPAMVKVKG